ncbi:MAG: IS21 family transposase [Clostridia bacterium]|nr:IS21 family transposase [Clostridia bacterium]
MTIRQDYQSGLNYSKIAEKYSIDWRTAKKYAHSLNYPKKKTVKRKSKLDDYKDYIEERLSNHNLTATKMLREIKQMGYQGGITILRTYMREIKQTLIQQATMRFETIPAKQGQVDWKIVTIYDKDSNQKLKVPCFVMTLGYSRMSYIEFCEDMKTETFIKCHLNAFQYFHGFPDELVYDNMKQVVIKRVIKANESTLNPLFLDFVTFYGFKPILCMPYRPQTKGKVERFIQYMEKDFLIGECFEDINDLNKRAQIWLDSIANERIHQTTYQKPSERFKKENLNRMHTLYQLPTNRFRKVSKDALVSYQSNKYSVPVEYILKEVEVVECDVELHFYYQDKKIAYHPLMDGKHGSSVNKEHYKTLTTFNVSQKRGEINTFYEKNLNSIDKTVESNLSEYDELFLNN